jgi:hypothetical protein
LLYLWHGELLAHGVRDYPLSEARRDLQLSALRRFAAAIRLYATLHHGTTTLRSALFRDEAIERHCAAVLELQAWQATPSLCSDRSPRLRPLDSSARGVCDIAGDVCCLQTCFLIGSSGGSLLAAHD